MANLIGRYQTAKNSKLVSEDLTLVIGTRRKPSANKTKHYLLAIRGEKTFEYVSSMYPVAEVPNTFQIDYKGANYILIIDKAEAVIMAPEKADTSNPLCISIGISATELHSQQISKS